MKTGTKKCLTILILALEGSDVNIYVKGSTVLILALEGSDVLSYVEMFYITYSNFRRFRC